MKAEWFEICLIDFSDVVIGWIDFRKNEFVGA